MEAERRRLLTTTVISNGHCQEIKSFLIQDLSCLIRAVYMGFQFQVFLNVRSIGLSQVSHVKKTGDYLHRISLDFIELLKR